jgi:hypothetical protein
MAEKDSLTLRASCSFNTAKGLAEVHCYSDGLYNYRVVMNIAGVVAKQEDYIDWAAKVEHQRKLREGD